MNRHYQASIDDIYESLQKIQSYIFGITEKEFEKNTEKQDAVLRRFEIIGEAVKNIPEDFRMNHPKIAWRNLAGLRDVIIHQYFGISVGLIWKFCNTDVPNLKKEFRKIKKDLQSKKQ